jgi:tRNA nucleotidyltransferase (CCA-adding enzyme)
MFPNHQKINIMGKFPVYLNDNMEEVALTRSEDFSEGGGDKNVQIKEVGTSIDKDLARRDFSINSIAIKYSDGSLVDTFNGAEDIKNRLIRTINDRFVIEDPNRVYRLARFVAEFDFNIDSKTIQIVKRDKAHVAEVQPERIYAELKKTYERASQPSIFFRVLFHLDVLKYHFPYFNVASRISAGPNQYHGSKSVFEHLLDAFDNAKLKGHSFDVALASLHHDLGKILTDKKLLPKHHGHENRGYKLVNWIEKHHRFTAKQLELMRVSGYTHMRFHVLEKIQSPIKLIRFYKAIKRNVEEVIEVADNDHELNAEQHKILADLKRTFAETKIEIPKEISVKGKEAIINFVEQRYASTYKEITR